MVIPDWKLIMTLSRRSTRRSPGEIPPKLTPRQGREARTGVCVALPEWLSFKQSPRIAAAATVRRFNPASSLALTMHEVDSLAEPSLDWRVSIGTELALADAPSVSLAVAKPRYSEGPSVIESLCRQ